MVNPVTASPAMVPRPAAAPASVAWCSAAWPARPPATAWPRCWSTATRTVAATTRAVAAVAATWAVVAATARSTTRRTMARSMPAVVAATPGTVGVGRRRTTTTGDAGSSPVPASEWVCIAGGTMRKPGLPGFLFLEAAFRLGAGMAELPCPLVVGSLLPLRSGASALRLRAEAGIAPRRAPHFSLLRQSKVPKRKATRSQGHFVVPCAARARGVPAKLAALKQTRGLIPLALRCSALPHGKGGCGRACERADEISCGAASSSAGGPVLIVLSRAPAPDRAAKQPRPPSKTTRRRCAAAAVGSRPHPPVGHGEQRRLGRKKGSRLFERSEFSETPPKLSSAADPAQQGVHVGSPFFAYFFWRSKKSEAPAGRNPGLRPQPKNRSPRAQRQQRTHNKWTRQIHHSRPQPESSLQKQKAGQARLPHRAPSDANPFAGGHRR